MNWNISVLKKRPLEPTDINNKPILVECHALSDHCDNTTPQAQTKTLFGTTTAGEFQNIKG